jgi:hypothetical protein
MSDRMGELPLPCPITTQMLVATAVRVAEAASRVAAQHPGDGFASLRQLRRDRVTGRMMAIRTGRLHHS